MEKKKEIRENLIEVFSQLGIPQQDSEEMATECVCGHIDRAIEVLKETDLEETTGQAPEDFLYFAMDGLLDEIIYG